MKTQFITGLSKTVTATLVAALLTGYTYGTGKTGGDNKTYKVSSESSTVEWIGKKVTGQHNGNVKIAKGDLILSNNTIKGGSLSIDMTSITCLDMQGEYSDKLINHLKSDDFFSVPKNPNAEFTITSVTPIKNAKEGDRNYTIKGKLTIKGITNEIEFPATITVRDNALVAIGEIIVDRTKWDIKYGSASFFESLGDKAIDNNFSLKFKLAAKG